MPSDSPAPVQAAPARVVCENAVDVGVPLPHDSDDLLARLRLERTEGGWLHLPPSQRRGVGSVAAAYLGFPYRPPIFLNPSANTCYLE